VVEADKEQLGESNGKPRKMLALFDDVHQAFRQFLLDEKIHSANDGVKILLDNYRKGNGGGVHN